PLRLRGLAGARGNVPGAVWAGSGRRSRGQSETAPRSALLRRAVAAPGRRAPGAHRAGRRVHILRQRRLLQPPPRQRAHRSASCLHRSPRPLTSFFDLSGPPRRSSIDAARVPRVRVDPRPPLKTVKVGGRLRRSDRLNPVEHAPQLPSTVALREPDPEALARLETDSTVAREFTADRTWAEAVRKLNEGH